MRDRSMRSGTELAREIKLTDWSMAGNLSNRSSGVQIPRDICTRLKRYLYSAKCSWIINLDIAAFQHFKVFLLLPNACEDFGRVFATEKKKKIFASLTVSPLILSNA